MVLMSVWDLIYKWYLASRVSQNEDWRAGIDGLTPSRTRTLHPQLLGGEIEHSCATGNFGRAKCELESPCDGISLVSYSCMRCLSWTVITAAFQCKIVQLLVRTCPVARSKTTARSESHVLPIID